MADAPNPPSAVTPAPSQVVLLVDQNQKKAMRNTFLLWEVVTLGVGLYVGWKFIPRSE